MISERGDSGKLPVQGCFQSTYELAKLSPLPPPRRRRLPTHHVKMALRAYLTPGGMGAFQLSDKDRDRRAAHDRGVAATIALKRCFRSRDGDLCPETKPARRPKQIEIDAIAFVVAEAPKYTGDVSGLDAWAQATVDSFFAARVPTATTGGAAAPCARTREPATST